MQKTASGLIGCSKGNDREKRRNPGKAMNSQERTKGREVVVRQAKTVKNAKNTLVQDRSVCRNVPFLYFFLTFSLMWFVFMQMYV